MNHPTFFVGGRISFICLGNLCCLNSKMQFVGRSTVLQARLVLLLGNQNQLDVISFI
jgi:hypothetical protein